MAANRRDRKRKGTPVWIRLGEELTGRRAELDPAWENRAAFAEARDVNLKLIQDLEANARENFTLLTLRDVIAPAYGVTFPSIRAFLDGTGDLEAAPGTPPRRTGQVPAAERSPSPPPAAAEILPADVKAAAEPVATRIFLRLIDLAANGITSPDGHEVFPGDARSAERWDDNKPDFDLGDPQDLSELVWLVAGLSVRASVTRRRQAGTGLRPAGTQPGRASR